VKQDYHLSLCPNFRGHLWYRFLLLPAPLLQELYDLSLSDHHKHLTFSIGVQDRRDGRLCRER
jgi:hypothetical protein